VIHHLATKSPTNPLPTSSTVAEAASVAGTVFSCDFASVGGRFGRGKEVREIKNPTGVSERKTPQVDQRIPGKSVGF